MFYFVLAVAVVAVLNLLLTWEILRRLREAERPRGAAEAMIPEGSSPAAFVATDTDGQTVEVSDLRDSLVGFFSAGCSACADVLPGFLHEARRDRAVAVVIDVGEAGTRDLVRQLEPVARVVVEKYGGQVSSAFGVRSLPAVCRTDVHGAVAVGHRHLVPALREVRAA